MYAPCWPPAQPASWPGACQPGPGPARVGNIIAERRQVNHLTWLRHIIRLKKRSRIGDNEIAIDAKLVAAADVSRCAQALIPTIVILRHAPWMVALFQ